MEPLHRTAYRANLIRVWDSWVVEVPEAAGVHCPVSHVEEAEETARHAIATVLGVDPRSVSVVVDRD